MAEGHRATPNGRGIEIGAFQQQVVGLRGDLGVRSAHDPGQGHRAAVALNHQGPFGHGPVEAVQGAELLAGLGQGHLDAVDARAVEGVHRLAQLGHDVVGQIDQDVDGPQAHVGQPNLHPQRSRLRPHPGEAQGAISRAAGRIVDGDGNLRQIRLGEFSQRHHRVTAQRGGEHGGHLASDAVVAPQVGPVGDRLVVHLHDPVVEEGHVNGLAWLGRRRQEDGVLADGRQAERIAGDDHALAGPAVGLANADSPDLGQAGPRRGIDDELPGGKARGRGHAVQRTPTDLQAHRIEAARPGDRLDPLDAGGDQAAGRGGQVLDALDLRHGHGEALGQGPGVQVVGQAHEIRQPVE